MPSWSACDTSQESRTHPLLGILMQIADRFPSIEALISSFAGIYPQSRVEVEAKDPVTGERHNYEAPRYLFRGESSRWETTLSSNGRLRKHAHRAFETIPAQHQKAFYGALDSISCRAEASFRDWMGLDPLTSAGYAQHYGLPTELFDFSQSLDVAIGFAVGDDSYWREPRTALIGVLDVERAAGTAITVDLGGMMEWARRPFLQQAYGFFHRVHEDLKADELGPEAGIRWYEVAIAPDEAALHAPRPELLDAHGDRAAGMLQLVLDEIAAFDGGWPKPIASYFAGAIPAAPLVGRRDPESKATDMTMELVSAEEAGIPFNQDQERELNFMVWSAQYPQSSPKERHDALLARRAAARQ